MMVLCIMVVTTESGKWLESGFNSKVEPTSLAEVLGMGTKRKKHQRRLLILQTCRTERCYLEALQRGN